MKAIMINRNLIWRIRWHGQFTPGLICSFSAIGIRRSSLVASVTPQGTGLASVRQ
jgi:hypothetical protein